MTTNVATLPSPPVAKSTWPGLVAAVGGEAGIRAFTAASTPLEGGPDRWLGAVQFLPNICGIATPRTPLDPSCSTGSTLFESTHDDGAPALVQNTPLIYWDASVCSLAYTTDEEVNSRATGKLDITFSWMLEYELWTGATHRAAGLTGQWLTDGTASILKSGTAIAPVRALAELQNAYGDCSQGGRGMIHCAPQLLTVWLNKRVIAKENGLYVDAFGNIIVAGSGYDGSGPSHGVDAAGDTSYAYITPMVAVRATNTAIVDATDRRYDLTNNTNRAIAWRTALAYYDDCCRYGINVNLYA